MRSAFLDAYSAYRLVLDRPALLFRFGFWPLMAAIVMVVLLGPVTGIVFGLLTSLPGIPGFAASTAALFLIGLPWCWLTAVIAVRWHRLVLLGEDQTSGLKGAFGLRTGSFFAWLLLLEALFIAGFAAGFGPLVNFSADATAILPASRGLTAMIWPAIVTTAFIAFFSGLYAVLLSQIGLVFPSIAADQPTPWGRLWRLSEGRRTRNLLTLFFVSLVPAILWSATAWFITKAFSPRGDMQLVTADSGAVVAMSAPSLAEGLTTYAFSVVILMATVSATAVALSHMYRSGTEKQTG